MRIICIFTAIALELFNTLESIDTPNSVKAYGVFLVPPQLDVTDCDIKFVNSS